MTQYCPNCNHEFAPEERACAQCGAERPPAIQKMPTRILNQAPSGAPPVDTAPAETPALSPETVDPAARWGTGFGLDEPEAVEAPSEDNETTDPSMPTFWQCKQCVSLNPSFVDYCETCGALKPDATPVKLGATASPGYNQDQAGPVPVTPPPAQTAQEERDTAGIPAEVMAILAAQDLVHGRGWQLVSSSGTDEGLSRKGGANEDSLFSMELRRCFESRSEALGIYMVADGMGGQAAGEVASRLAIQSIAPIVLSELAGIWMAGGIIERGYVERVMHDAISLAHTRLREYNLQEDRDAGTTITACCVLDGWAVFANVGDSRTYLLRQPRLAVSTEAATDPIFPVKSVEEMAREEEAMRNGVTQKLSLADRKTAPLTQNREAATNPLHSRLQLERVTRDQSLVQHLVEQGEITYDDVYSDPRRNVILHALGAPDDQVPVDLYFRQLEPGDTIVLCSDGLWEMVRDNDIADQVQAEQDVRACARNLIALANRNGGADNISVIVVKAEKS